MNTSAVLLVLAAVLVHLAWNLRSSAAASSIGWFWRATLGSLPLLLPLLLLPAGLAAQPLSFWLLVLATGLAQALYYSGLAAAYRHGDLGVAYPLVRALPVLLVPVVGLAAAALAPVLFRASPLGTSAWLAMLAIAMACLALPDRRPQPGQLLWPLLAGLGTTAYTLIDAAALGMMLDPALALPPAPMTAALVFLALQSCSAALWLTLLVLLRGASSGSWRAAAGTGVLINLAYGLVLAAMTQVDNVAYVAAFRQLGIPLGVVAGVLLLGETFSRRRLFAAATIAVAAAALALS